MADHSELIARYEAAGQGHVFAYWNELDPEQKEQLASQATEIDLAEIDELNRTLVQGTESHGLDLEGLEPAPFIARPESGGDPAVWASAKEAGEEALRAGRVAAFVVAGGQGTRLGYNGPKGTFPVTPALGKPLFQVFAEKIGAASRRYGRPIQWYIMTSPINHEATVTFFQNADYFGLEPNHIHFFSQGTMPAVSLEGKILLETRSSIARSPDGHGGSLRALVRSGATATMAESGADIISYFQVDNPLVQVIDPTFIGFHLQHQSSLSSKMLPKAYASEKLGLFCMQGGQMKVIEYSDMPMEMQEETGPDGRLRFLAGSIAIHTMSREFVEKVGAGTHPGFRLPFHRANKKIGVYDPANGETVKPDTPNGIKFEMFVFDAIPFADNPLVIETVRGDDFSPVKNAEGIDSPRTAKEDQLRQFARWLKAAGEGIETDETGLPSITFEVSPLFAEREDVFVEKWKARDPKPEVSEGACIL